MSDKKTTELANISQFDYLKTEATALVASVNKTVASSSGAEGEALIRENKKVLQVKRSADVALLKEARAGAVKFQKDVVGFNKELLAIYEVGEAPLDEKIKEINDAIEMEKRMKVLPERKELMDGLELDYIDAFLLDMSDKDFAIYYQERKGIWLDEKELKIKEKEAAQLKIKEDQEKEAKRLKDIEEARIIEQKRAAQQADIDKAQAEKDKNDALEAAKIKADAEKQKIIDDQERKDEMRRAEVKRQDEALKAKIEADRVTKEQLKADEERKQLLIEANKKYQDFLTSNKYNEDTDYILKAEGQDVLYRQVAVFKK